MKMRDTVVDTTKFIAILFVVLGHCNSCLSSFFYSFHVQMFFILSGYMCTATKWNSFMDYLLGGGKKLIIKLLLPYFLFAFLYGKFNIINACCYLYGSNQTMIDTPGHLWFLPAFFLSVLIFNSILILFKDFRNVYIEVLVCILFVILAYYTSYEKEIVLNIASLQFSLTDIGQINKADEVIKIGFPFGVNIAFMGIAFMFVGRWLKMLVNNIELNNLKFTLPAFFLCFTIGLFCHICNKQPEGLPYVMKCNMSFAEYGTVFPLFLGSSVFLGLAFFFFSHLINNKLMAKIGALSMAIYLLHPFFIWPTKVLLTMFGLDYTLWFWGPDLVGALVFVLTCLVVLLNNRFKIVSI